MTVPVASFGVGDFYELLLVLVPTVTIGALPLFGLVIVLDLLLYSKSLPAMRAQMGEQKWPAWLVAGSPIAAGFTVKWMEKHRPGVLPAELTGAWSLFTGAMFCSAFAACWLLLPADPDERPARALNQELKLALCIWVVDALVYVYSD